MKFILAIIVTLVFCYTLRKSIKKHAVYYYIGATIVSIVTIFCEENILPNLVNEIMGTFFRYGTLSTAMFSLVMYMNIFPNGSKIQKVFMPIRGELSIIACILTYGHNFYTGKTYVTLFLKSPEMMNVQTKLALLVTFVLCIIMTPLFITSFKCVRKKMKPIKWKKLQQSAYAFYMLIYVHVMILMLPMAVNGNQAYIFNVIVYSTVFLLYGRLRLMKYYRKSRNAVAIVWIVVMYLGAFGMLIVNLYDFEDGKTFQSETQISDIPDGKYTGEGMGYRGTITAIVTVSGGEIVEVEVADYVDDKKYMKKAIQICEDMVEEQAIEVDAISGATYSSDGIKAAVLDALSIEK